MGVKIPISDVILYMQMPIWNGDCAIMPWLVLGASQRWGSRVVQVVVGSHWSGLRESSCQSQSAAGSVLGLHHQWCSLVSGQSSRSAGWIIWALAPTTT